MHSELLPYYNDELVHLRVLGREFAQQFPKVAARLQLAADTAEDPHVERLIESFAFLTARIRHKLDDELPEITDGLLNILYPHVLRPTPSMSIVQFEVDPDEISLTTRYTVPRHTTLFSRPVNNEPCRFRTCYPVDLWPIRLKEAKVELLDRAAFGTDRQAASAVIRLRLEALAGQTFKELAIDHLRFFIEGDPPLSHALYELIHYHTLRVTLSGGGSLPVVTLPATAIRKVGFGEEDGLLDYDSRSPLAYRLLHEYFSFPDKFMYFEVDGLAPAAVRGFGKELEITLWLGDYERPERMERLVRDVGPATFRLGCTPVVNLFRKNAEPIQITHLKTEYQIIPDVRRPMDLEVYSVDAVRKVVKTGERGDVVEYQPFYSLKHTLSAEAVDTFWIATRRPSPWQDDEGTEVHLALVDRGMEPSLPSGETISITLTCTNRDLPGMLPFGGEEGDFQMEGGASVKRIRCLRKPTQTLRPQARRAAMWRLISHLSLNYLSIVDSGREAFLEILSLYNFTHSVAVRKQISGIVAVSSRPTMARCGPLSHTGFVRGTEVSIDFDETEYEGSGIFMLADVLDNFLAHYAAINSFTQLVVRSRQREKAIRRWPPRAGRTSLV